MKELTIEQKAQRYDEAIKRARQLQIDGCSNYDKETIWNIFPELKENEDENVRKDMMETIKKESKDFPSSVIAEKSRTWLAWLEKQGEQKPAWSEEDESFRLRTIGALETCKIGSPTKSVDEQINWLKSLKDRYTWKPSDGQIKACKEVYADILSAKGFDIGTVNNELNRLEEELKKLREE